MKKKTPKKPEKAKASKKPTGVRHERWTADAPAKRTERVNWKKYSFEDYEEARIKLTFAELDELHYENEHALIMEMIARLEEKALGKLSGEEYEKTKAELKELRKEATRFRKLVADFKAETLRCKRTLLKFSPHPEVASTFLPEKKLSVPINERASFMENLVERDVLGYSRSDTWELSATIASLVLPRLKLFRELTMGRPTEFKTHAAWLKVLDKIIKGFESTEELFFGTQEVTSETEEGVYTDDWGDDDVEISEEMTPEEREKWRKGFDARCKREAKLEKEIREGLELFSKYFLDLGW